MFLSFFVYSVHITSQPLAVLYLFVDGRCVADALE